MLLQRTLTAIVLVVILLAAVMAPMNWPLQVFIGLAASACLWEWLRLTLGMQRSAIPLVAGFAFLALTILVGFQGQNAVVTTFPVTHNLRWFMALVVLFWIFGGGYGLYQARAQVSSRSLPLSIFGVLAVFSAWLSLAYIYEQAGAVFLVSVMALVWAADIAAYFGGKAFGTRKLAPAVSPGKTWEGAIFGVLASIAWVVISQWWPGSFGAFLFSKWSWWFVVVLAAALGVLSIIGDLFESLLKRRVQAKDSSQLLPGHGGVFDRLDALLPIAPLVFLLLT